MKSTSPQSPRKGETCFNSHRPDGRARVQFFVVLVKGTFLRGFNRLHWKMGAEVADSLLLRLLQEHPDGDGRWAAIEEAYNAESTEKRSRMWLKNRAKKVSTSGKASAESSLCAHTTTPAPLQRATEKAAPISRGVFEKMISQAGITDTSSVSVDNLYHKFKGFPTEELPALLRWVLEDSFSSCDTRNIYLVPCVNVPSWIYHAKKSGLSNFTTTKLDVHGLLHLFAMQRMSQHSVGGKSCFADGLDDPDLVSPKNAAQNLGRAMSWLEQRADKDLEIQEIIPGSFLSVRCKACCALPRMAMPQFVRDMEKRLGIDSQSEIIIVPFGKDKLYIAKSSSALGCNALGDFIDAVDTKGERHGNNNCMYSVPFRVKFINSSGLPASFLLAQSRTSVEWELYPFFGQNASYGPCTLSSAAVLSFGYCAPSVDQVIRCSIPRSEHQADEWNQSVQTNAKRKSKSPKAMICAISFEPEHLAPSQISDLEAMATSDRSVSPWLMDGTKCAPLSLRLAVCSECFLPMRVTTNLHVAGMGIVLRFRRTLHVTSRTN